MITFELDDGEKLHQENRDTFWIPSRMERENLLPGEIVKLIFRILNGGNENVERMWVIVKERFPDYYVGILDNDPNCTTELCSGAEVQFKPEHVINIYGNLPNI